MANDFYNHTDGVPVAQSRGSSTAVRAEFDLVQAGFNALPSQKQLYTSTENYSADTGTANTYLVTLPSGFPFGLVAGMEVVFKAANTNTGASVLQIAGWSTYPIVRPDGTALNANDITAGQIITVRYDGSANFQIFPFGSLSSSVAVAQSYATAANTWAGMAATSYGNAHTSELNAAASASTAASLLTGIYAESTNSADVFTASFSNLPSTLTDGYTVQIGVAVPNTTTSPTFRPTLGGVLQTAHPIMKFVNGAYIAVAIGDVQGVAVLSYDLPNTTWELMSPQFAQLAGSSTQVFNVAAATLAGHAVRLSQISSATVPMFSAYQSALQALASNAFSIIQLQTKEWDTVTAFNNTASPATLNGYTVPAYSFMPTVTGYYQVNCAASIATGATQLTASIYKTGSRFKDGANSIAATAQICASVSAQVYLVAGTDYITFEIYHSSGASINSAIGINNTYFQASLIARA